MKVYRVQADFTCNLQAITWLHSTSWLASNDPAANEIAC